MDGHLFDVSEYKPNAETSPSHKRLGGEPVLSVVFGDNSELIWEVCRLYYSRGMKVADVTYGKGVFWRKRTDIDVSGSDIQTCPDAPYDFRSLPYPDDSFDIVVLDPPYIHNPGNHHTDSRYQNASTTTGMYHDDIRKLYFDGMIEARRVLVDGGQLWVKCKDQIEGGKQCWSHCEILQDATSLGFYGRDLFLLVSAPPAEGRWKRQLHSRKPHSYLWIFENRMVN